jgi:Na+/melibiose symporter-like transporter
MYLSIIATVTTKITIIVIILSSNQQLSYVVMFVSVLVLCVNTVAVWYLNVVERLNHISTRNTAWETHTKQFYSECQYSSDLPSSQSVWNIAAPISFGSRLAKQ